VGVTCEHRKQMFVPSEDDPEVMAQICLQCHEILAVAYPDDGELEAIGDSLGDPDEEDY
jgi:hypothetical protein